MFALTVAAALLATAPTAGADARRSAIAVCLQTDHFTLSIDRVWAEKARASEADWRSDCRAAREADERRRSIVRVLFTKGKSPVGGYTSTIRMLTLAAAAPDPVVADLFRHSAREQAARESLSRLSRETWARGLSPLALMLLDGLVSADAVQADLENRVWLEGVVARRGWFRVSRDGADADGAAWLIIQHADADRTFQRRAIGWLEPLTATGDTSPIRFAYLFDRWAAGAGQPQRYGLQGACDGQGRWRPLEIEDAPNVDARRRAAGLDSTLTEWVAQKASAC